VYGQLPSSADEPYRRLVGWTRVALASGESKIVSVPIDDYVLKTFDEEKNAWNMTPGDYQVLVGGSSDSTPLTGTLVVR
jgi:beta-glucosidase